MFRHQTQSIRAARARKFSIQSTSAFAAAGAALALAVIFSLPARLEARVTITKSNITGYYQLNPFNTLAILDQHGNIEGHLDVFQGSSAPVVSLSYNITAGSLKKGHVEFKTQKIHGKYYQFSGTVARGVGKENGDYDFLRLAGNLEIITPKSATGKAKVQRLHAIFKSLPQDNAGS